MKEVRPGIFAGERWSPIDSIACYVPRGKGSFPSVAVMTAVPAVVATVPRIIICTPPMPDGRTDPATLVAARLAGVSEVYRCGGAQAVAAVAYGTRTVPRVVKMVGPGSPYLVAAKKLLSDRIDPGILAGPSESIILADETADPAWANRELPQGMPVQGNLDPLALISGGPPLKEAVSRVLDAFSGRPHIFNLGHGIQQDTPLAHVEELMALVKGGI